MSSLEFYTVIAPFVDRAGVSNPANYHSVPVDWLIFLSDIRGSTKAIESGKYKDVNLVGVSCITAVKNACARAEIPYVFGGDGASFLIPPEFDVVVQEALLGVTLMAQEEFGFDLRVRRIPVERVNEANHQIKFGRFKVSEHLTLAVFAGSGLSEAERLAKAIGVEGLPFEFSKSIQAKTDFSGLECRWEPIASQKGEILSVLVKVNEPLLEKSQTLYKNIIEELELILGQGARDIMPLHSAQMKVTRSTEKLRGEAKIKSFGHSVQDRASHLRKLWVNSFVGSFLVRYSLKAFGTDWGRYTQEVIENSDFWKYDDMLRFVADVSSVQKRAMLACLEQYRTKNEIFYGIHSSREALMTCFVESRQGSHVHFIDGADGGYAMAAKNLKAQI